MSKISSLRQAGFTMLEVLVTILIVAGAMLGTAGMQLAGLKLTQSSQLRTQAVFLAADIVERLEANNEGAKAGFYVRPQVIGSGAGAPNCNNASPCTAQQLADSDIRDFETNLVAQLPSPTASISRTGAGPWIYTVEITWQERTQKPRTSTAAASAATTETLTHTLVRTVHDRDAVI